MKIVVVVTDNSLSNELVAEHGLCVYVQTEKHNILADTGMSELTWENAEKLGIDIRNTDIVSLSHGHYDHSGGIMSFFEINKTARIFARESVFGNYYHADRYIGVDQEIKNLPTLCFTGSSFRLDDEVSFFSDIKANRFWPLSNAGLSEIKSGCSVPDDFKHEQCTVIKSERKTVLISGCAHNGILNIMDRFREIYGRNPDVVISGFHMNSPDEDMDAVKETAEELSKTETLYFTGHCTGNDAYSVMKQIMKDKLNFIYSGMEIYV